MSEMWTRMKSIRRSRDQRHPLGLVDEQLAHRDRDRRLLAQQREPADVLGREAVLEEEEPELLELLGQPDRLDRRDALVDVVQQLDLVAERACAGARTASARCRTYGAALHGSLHRVEVVRCDVLDWLPASAFGLLDATVGRVAGHGDLRADVA